MYHELYWRRPGYGVVDKFFLYQRRTDVGFGVGGFVVNVSLCQVPEIMEPDQQVGKVEPSLVRRLEVMSTPP